MNTVLTQISAELSKSTRSSRRPDGPPCSFVLPSLINCASVAWTGHSYCVEYWTEGIVGGHLDLVTLHIDSKDDDDFLRETYSP